MHEPECVTGTRILEPYTSGCSEASGSRTWRLSRYVGFRRASLLGRSQEVCSQRSKFGSAHISREPPQQGPQQGLAETSERDACSSTGRSEHGEESVEVIGAVRIKAWRRTGFREAKGTEASLKAAGVFKTDVVWLSESREDSG